MVDGKYYCNAILHAYKNNISIEKANDLEYRKRHLIADYHGKEIISLSLKKGIKGEYERLFAYLDKQDISNYLYLDYIRACNFLNLDCHDDTIRYPKDFQHWHDLLIAEMDVVRREEERQHKKQMEQEKRELAENFLKAAKKYLPLAGFTEDEHYAIFIAQSPTELVKEGNALSHCVGHCGYDRKMANEETLIFFVRKMEELDKPFVTLEYSIKKKQVLQCYAYNNTKPEEKVLEFVNNKWLPHANQQLEKIAA